MSEAKKCQRWKRDDAGVDCDRDATHVCLAFPLDPHYLCEVHALEHSLHKQFISGITPHSGSPLDTQQPE